VGGIMSSLIPKPEKEAMILIFMKTCGQLFGILE